MTVIIGFSLGIPTVSPNAQRSEFWAVRHKRVKNERRVAFWATKANLGRHKPELVKHVELIRFGRKLLDSHDNLPGCFKGFVDGIADALGVNDAKMSWGYRQEKGAPSVMVELHLEAPCDS